MLGGYHAVWCFQCHDILSYEACTHAKPCPGTDEAVFSKKPITRFVDQDPQSNLSPKPKRRRVAVREP